jgi:hypothetical protein
MINQLSMLNIRIKKNSQILEKIIINENKNLLPKQQA